MKKYTIELTESEINHILTLIANNKEEGWYYAPVVQYWKRSQNIEDKLNEIKKKIR